MARRGFSSCIFEDPNKMAAFLVQKWRTIADNAIARKGFFAAAHWGQTTPAVFYRYLAALKDSFPWDKTHIFLLTNAFCLSATETAIWG